MYPGAIAAVSPDKPAVIMAGSGQVITYRRLDEESNRLAHLFRAAGLRPGDHVAFMLGNHPLFLAIAWAAHRSGLYYTAINSRLQAAELSYIIENCGARVFISSADLADVAISDHRPAPPPSSCASCWTGSPTASSRTRRRWPGSRSPRSTTSARAPTCSTPPAPPACPRASSRPSRTRRSTEPGMLYRLIQGLFAPSADSVYLSPAPLYHAAPLRYSLTFQRLGATVVVMERFDPEEYLRLIEKYRVTHSQLVPTMFIKMLKLPAGTREKYDLSSLKCAIHAAAPCPIPVKEQMIDWWGPIIHEYYAGTEGNGFLYVNSADWLTHRGTVGRSLLGTVHICDENGAELPAGEHGTVYFDSGITFEYHGDPDKTRSVQDPLGRGWTTLGDIGYLDADGFLHLTDRRSYMIISGGVNIYPQEAENLLSVHPKVADVAVLGVPDEEMGEQVKAVVQPVSMAEAGPELEAELIEYCRARLAHYKCPKSVDFRAELPRHPTGKLYKRLLKDEYWPARP